MRMDETTARVAVAAVDNFDDPVLAYGLYKCPRIQRAQILARSDGAWIPPIRRLLPRSGDSVLTMDSRLNKTTSTNQIMRPPQS
jgi:hypothetical protein